MIIYINKHFNQNDQPTPSINQSLRPPFTLSQDVCGEKTAIPLSIALMANCCFQSFWTSRLKGRNRGGWYEIMRSHAVASASSITSAVRSLVRRIVLIKRRLPGSTKRPTLSQDSANESGASCSRTASTVFKSIEGGKWEKKREKTTKGGTQNGWKMKGCSPEWRLDEW